MFTSFMDMHSGGGQKEKFSHCFIEASEEEAKFIFYNRFGHNPERVTCTCCGEDYSISESEDLEQATGYQRGCLWEEKKYVERNDPSMPYRDYISLPEYLEKENVFVIYAANINANERTGEVPKQGYVWQD